MGMNLKCLSTTAQSHGGNGVTLSHMGKSMTPDNSLDTGVFSYARSIRKLKSFGYSRPVPFGRDRSSATVLKVYQKVSDIAYIGFGRRNFPATTPP